METARCWLEWEGTNSQIYVTPVSQCVGLAAKGAQGLIDDQVLVFATLQEDITRVQPKPLVVAKDQETEH